MSHPHVELAEGYVDAVLSGSIVACKNIRLACERHRRDLKNSKRKSCPYRFDPDLAEEVCYFGTCLPHTKGSWASRHETFTWQPWQAFFFSSVFGWVRKADGRRRFRTVNLFVARKNSKSTMAAVIGLYLFAVEGEFGSEVYSGATTEQQALEIFRPARLMALRSPEFCEDYGIEVNAKSLYVPGDGSRFLPVIGKPGDGASPYGALVDEYHEHDTDDLASTMRTGMGSRALESSPMIVFTSTAGDNPEGPCYAAWRRLEKILEGSIDDETTFGLAYSLDQGDDFRDPEVIIKANPNLEISVSREEIEGMVKEAIEEPQKQNEVLRKHFNLWTTAYSSWMNMAHWTSCGKPPEFSVVPPEPLSDNDPPSRILTWAEESGPPGIAGELEAHRDELIEMWGSDFPELYKRLSRRASLLCFRAQFPKGPCYVGHDGARKIDFNSSVFVFPDWEHEGGTFYRSFSRHYLPYFTCWDPSKQDYHRWAREGWLTVTDGDEIDFQQIEDELSFLVSSVDCREFVFDPAFGTHVSQAVARRTGVDRIEMPQRNVLLTGGMVEIEAAIKAGRYEHNGSPLQTWHFSNIVVRRKDKILTPKKEREGSKIDGGMAEIMVIARLEQLAGKVPDTSIYEQVDAGDWVERLGPASAEAVEPAPEGGSDEKQRSSPPAHRGKSIYEQYDPEEWGR